MSQYPQNINRKLSKKVKVIFFQKKDLNQSGGKKLKNEFHYS